MNNIWFFDRYGTPLILLRDLVDNRFVDRQGRNLGYISGNAIYNYGGRHCGWIENGVIRDLSGFSVAFMRGANDSPRPIFPIPQIPPIPAIRQISRIKPIKGFGWSPLSPISLFD